MSNERERLAREWAENLNTAWQTEYVRAALDHILATTTEPTMADVEWDEKYHLAGATTPAGHDAVMMWCDEESTGHIITDLGEWRPDQLTPNGKRYKLVEVTGGEHPETLTTVEDYKNAPVGTVVEGEGKLPWTRLEYVWKETAGDVQNDVGMAGTERRVLRWGWGE